MQHRPYILSTSKEGTKSLVANNTATLFCPKCGEQYNIKTSGMITCWQEGNSCPVTITPVYHCNCECSYEGNLIPVDSDIAYSMRALHTYGYHVEPTYSSSIDLGGEYPTVFVLFDKFYELPSNLPSLWKRADRIIYSTANRREAVEELEGWIKENHIDSEIAPWWMDL